MSCLPLNGLRYPSMQVIRRLMRKYTGAQRKIGIKCGVTLLLPGISVAPRFLVSKQWYYPTTFYLSEDSLIRLEKLGLVTSYSNRTVNIKQAKLTIMKKLSMKSLKWNFLNSALLPVKPVR